MEVHHSYGIVHYVQHRSTREDRSPEGRVVNGGVLYQLCQKRNSIPFIEFLKNNIDKKDLPSYINLMTVHERKICVSYYNSRSFRKLWTDTFDGIFANVEKDKFPISNTNVPPSISKADRVDRLLGTERAFYDNIREHMQLFKLPGGGELSLQWEFPKGRKNWSTEADIECALREFTEETGIDRKFITLINHPPFSTTYIGMNGHIYNSTYFIAESQEVPKIPVWYSSIGSQRYKISNEISRIGYFSYEECMKILDNTRKDLLKEINAAIIKMNNC